MTNTKFTKLIALAVKLEGKKSSLKIHDAREFMKIIKKLCQTDIENMKAVLKYLGE